MAKKLILVAVALVIAGSIVALVLAGRPTELTPGGCQLTQECWDGPSLLGASTVISVARAQ